MINFDNLSLYSLSDIEFNIKYLSLYKEKDDFYGL